MKNKSAILISVLVLTGIGIWFLLRDNPSLTSEAAKSVSQPAPPPTPTTESAPVLPPGSSPQPPPSPGVNSAPSTPEEAEFARWVSEEGQEINQRGMNSEQKREELEREAKKLTPAKANQLVRIAKNVLSPAGEKLIAAFLLVEAGAVAQEQLGSLIAAPLEYSGAQESHSEGEMRGAQERSMRVMAIEGLASRAETDASARATLERTIPTISDPYVKIYAEKRLAKIKSN